eukprot:5184631-Pyramimonas_sp.AAC.1
MTAPGVFRCARDQKSNPASPSRNDAQRGCLDHGSGQQAEEGFPSGGLWEGLGGLPLGGPGGLLERLGCLGELLGASSESLGSLLGASWAPLGASWGFLGAYWGFLEAILGALGALLGPSWRTSIKQEGSFNPRCPRRITVAPCLFGSGYAAER